MELESDSQLITVQLCERQGSLEMTLDGTDVRVEGGYPELRINGTGDHTKLINREAADQHPMEAITGLDAALAEKADSMEIDEDNCLWLLAGGVRIAGPFGPFGSGGGGGSANGAVLKVSNTTGCSLPLPRESPVCCR